MIFSETNSKIAPALAKAWGEIENPKHNTSVTVKTKSGASYKFDYTDLGGIFDEAKRVLKGNGLSVIQNAYTAIIEGKKMVSVETMLLHSSGEYVKSLPLQFEANANIQDMGGQITYMKRYSLSAMLGIATEKDDDANGSMGNEVKFNDKPNGVTVATLKAKWETLAGDLNGFDKFYQDQLNAGYNNNQMDVFLTKKLQAKKGA